jgi:PAS domain S-box-containing protein
VARCDGPARLDFFDLAALSWEIVCEATQDGYFRFVNSSWTRILGWSTQEMVGRHYRDFLHPDDIAETAAAQSMAAHGEVRDFFNRYRHRDGHYVWLEWRGQAWGVHQVGVARAVPDPRPPGSLDDRGAMASLLQASVQSGVIQVWFQPIVSIPDREVRGYEALLRRIVPGEAPQDAGQWLPLIASMGLMTDLSHFVVKQTVHFLSRLPKDAWVSINVTAEELTKGDVAQTIAVEAAAAGVSASRIAVELGDRRPLISEGSVLDALHRCTAEGVRLFMDDFGTSYAALAHLRTYPITGLKLDRSFVSALPHKRPLAVATGVARLAQQLGLLGIAEGVESEGQEKWLVESGWTLAQGWLYGAAAPAARHLGPGN